MELGQLQSRSTVQPSNLVNSRDHGAYVTVTAILCLIFSLLFVAARLSVRWPSKATLGRDDYVAPLALVSIPPLYIHVQSDGHCRSPRSCSPYSFS